VSYFKYVSLSLILFLVVACSAESVDQAPMPNVLDSVSAGAKQKTRGEYLAYEHRITVSLPGDSVGKAFDEVISFCTRDTVNKCTILHSTLNAGNYVSSSNIQVRIVPGGVDALLATASKQGEVIKRSTDVEDLQETIVNGNKRLEMLLKYQSRLTALEKKSHNDVESLIKIAQELSQVQSDIEYAQGEKNKLLQRTQMDVVYISFHALSYTSFWGPISDALSDFGENLSEGISLVVVAIAYLFPRVILIGFLLYITRVIWRKTRVSSAKTR